MLKAMNFFQLKFSFKLSQMVFTAFKKHRPGLLTGVIAGSTATLLLLLVGTFIWIQRKQNAKIKMHRLKLEQMKYNNDLRYTNLPKKLVIIKFLE